MKKAGYVSFCAAAVLLGMMIITGCKRGPNPVVEIMTSMGEIKVELYADKAPVSVKNFLAYVEKGHYNKVIFHRVIKSFMIQGGGFTPDMKQ